MVNHIILFRYEVLTDAKRRQLQEMNSRYVSKNPVIVVDETYHLIVVASDDENLFEEVRKAITQLKIMGLQIEWLDESDSKELQEQELLAKLDTRKIN